MLDINTIKKNQVFNLIEYGILVIAGQENRATMHDPSYLLEKFQKHFGEDILPTEQKPNEEIDALYAAYCKRWRSATGNQLVCNIHALTCGVCKHGFSLEVMIYLFNKLFTGTISNYHYRSLHAVLRRDVFDKYIEEDKKVSRILSLAELQE